VVVSPVIMTGFFAQEDTKYMPMKAMSVMMIAVMKSVDVSGK